MDKLKPQKATLKKDAMVQALEKSLGIVTTACKNVGIDRKTHYRWLEEDSNYRQAVQSLTDVALDFAETKLHTLINEGDTAATIFYLKTKGKGRGYIERQELSTEIKSINITIDGTNI